MHLMFINGCPLAIHSTGGLVIASLGEPRAEVFVTAATERDAFVAVVRQLSHADDSAR